MVPYKNIFLLSILTLIYSNIFGQVKNPNLGTETVNVVKPFTPAVSDAFKIIEVPSLDDEETNRTENIKYTIFSVPVASTFTPSKGVAANVEKTVDARAYDNYATLGFGSYASAVAAVFITHKFSNSEFVSGMFRHNSAQGDIKGVELDNKFYDTKFDLDYSNKQSDLSWTSSLGYQNQVYNWYGLPANFGFGLTPEQRATLVSGINPSHTFHDFKFGGNVDFTESLFSGIALNFNRFWDNYGSAEHEFSLKPNFKFDIADNAITLKTAITYIDTNFEKFYQANLNNPTITNFQNQNSYFALSLNPNYTVLRDDLTLNLGAEFTYLNTLKNTANGTDFGSSAGIYFYPKVTASYKVVGDLMIAFGGVEGGLNQNSYRNFVSENPFVSPTLSILPTDATYDLYAGLKGKLANNLGYNVKASYLTEKNKALFRSNFFNPTLQNDNYEHGNSFTVVYDNVRTVSFYGELKADFSEKIVFGVNGTFASFNNSFQEEVWNLPTIKVATTMDVNFTKKWFAGANVFFVGERKDQISEMSPALIAPPIFNLKTVVLPGFFDANLNFGYRHNQRISAFLKANNIGNQLYQRWLNFPVQQLQLILGANYKFDF